MIHHSSDKDDRNAYLGSTFIRASLDAGYFVETTKDPRNGDRQLVEFYSIKGRREAAWTFYATEIWNSPIRTCRELGM